MSLYDRNAGKPGRKPTADDLRTIAMLVAPIGAGMVSLPADMLRALLDDYRARGEALRDLRKRNLLEDGVALDFGIEALIDDALKGAGDEP